MLCAACSGKCSLGQRQFGNEHCWHAVCKQRAGRGEGGQAESTQIRCEQAAAICWLDQAVTWARKPLPFLPAASRCGMPPPQPQLTEGGAALRLYSLQRCLRVERLSWVHHGCAAAQRMPTNLIASVPNAVEGATLKHDVSTSIGNVAPHYVLVVELGPGTKFTFHYQSALLHSEVRTV